MVGWHHQLNGHEFEQALGDLKELGSLVCCSPWGLKESDTTEQQQRLQYASLRFSFSPHRSHFVNEKSET